MTKISTLGAELASIARLSKTQSSLGLLTEQLSSGIKSESLLDYSTTDAKNMLDLNASRTRKEAYLESMKTVSARIKVYDTALTGVEDVASQAVTLCSTSSAYNSTTNSTTATTLKSYMEQISYYMNQQVSGRYIFAGTRYTQQPISDVSSWPALTLSSSTTPQASPNLPDYDGAFNSAYPVGDVNNQNASAFQTDKVQIDNATNLDYGISSDNAAFQDLITGLRLAYAATQDSTNYSALMAKAQPLIQSGLSEIQSLHTGLSSDSSTLNSVKTRLTDDISSIDNSITDIRQVDTNEVAVKITTMQTQLEASYSATSKLLTMSILNYL